MRYNFQGRPTPVYHCQNLSNLLGRTQIYLKREDLNHTGAHKLNHCMGDAFETICMEYLIRLAKKRKLPFVPYSIGKWWGNNPAIKEQDDVDILLMNDNKSQAIFVECKFTSKKMSMSEYDDLVTATRAFSNIEKKYMMFISKSGYEASVVKRAKKEGTTLLTIKDLFTV